jgi:RHS repeat-associated protein
MALLACGDVEPTPEVVERAGAALTVATVSVLGFEDPAAWAVPAGIAKTRSTTHTEGAFALAVGARGFVTVRSVPVAFNAPVAASLTYDLMLPTQQPNPSWLGATQAYLECPTANVFNAYLGQTELTGLPLAQWRRISYVVPAEVRAQLAQGCPALTVTIVVNVPTNATGTYLLDNLALGASTPSLPTVDRRGEVATIDETMGCERADRWTVTGATLATDTRHTDGARSLALTNLGRAELRSVALGTLPGVTSTIGFEVMLPSPQPPPAWTGFVELYIDVPSLAVTGRLLGRQELAGKPVNQWLMVRFPVDAALTTRLRQRYRDLSFRIVVSVPPGSSGPFLIDNLRTNDVRGFLHCVLTQAGRARALFGYDNPSSEGVEIADAFANRVSGSVTDLLPVQPPTFFQTGRRHGALWADVTDPQIHWKVGRNVATALRTGSPACTVTPGSNGGSVTVGTHIVPVPGASTTGIVPSERIGTTTTTPGVLSGTFAVDDNGGAGYRIPLRVTAGRAGVEPELSLSYGGDQNGLLGVGWSLTGLSQISRCARTVALDGFAEDVSFDEGGDAAFCLDGERLIPVGGTSADVNGREYRTERNTFARIVARRTTAGNGPDTFEASLPDGRVLTYGGGTAVLGGSRVQYTASRQSRTPAVVSFPQQVRLAWSLAELRDRHGNSMRYSYANSQDSVDRGQQHVPSRIDYTFFSDGTPGLRSVRFVYTARPDDELSYVSGFPIRIAQRLSRVEMWGPNQSPSGMSRVYELTYNRIRNPFTGNEQDFFTNTARSLLTKVTECDAAGTCLEPTRFGWTSGTPLMFEDHVLGDFPSPASARAADVDGDGKDDVIFAGGVGPCTQAGGAGYYFRRSTGTAFPASTSAFIARICSPTQRADLVSQPEQVPFDMDTDGKMDFAAYLSDQADPDSIWRIFHSNGTALAPTGWLNEIDIPQGRSIPRHYYGDLTGDGRTDMLSIAGSMQGTVGTWRIDASFPLTGPPPTQTLLGPAMTILPGNFGAGANNYIARIHGDARMSMLHQDLSASVIPVRYAEATLGRDGRVLVDAAGKVRLTTLQTAETGAYRFGDFNGDGLTDAISFLFDPAAGQVVARHMINTGNGFSDERIIPLSPMPPFPGRIADIDGDGKQDLVAVTSHGLSVFRGLPQGGVSPVERLNSSLPSPTGLFETIDANGDGLTDILMSSGGVMHLLTNTGPKPDMLTGIIDGARKSIGIFYAPMSDPTVYTPAAGCVYPLTCVKRGRWLVSRYTEDDGTAPLGLGQPQSLRTFDLTYAGGKADLKGRGWLGFASRTVTDQRTGRSTVMEFHNDGDGGVVDPAPGAFVSYPKAGLKKTELVIQPLFDRLPEVAVVEQLRTWTYRLLAGAEVARGRSYAFRVRTMTEDVWDRPLAAPGQNQFLVRSSDTTFDHDDFANETLQDIRFPDGAFERRERTYNNLTTPWLIGLPDRVTLTSHVPGKPDQVRVTRHVTNPITGAIDQTIQEPDGGAELFLQTDFVRETHGRGQVTGIIETDSEGKPRTSSIIYDAVDGVFPDTLTNPAGHVTRAGYNGSLGVPLIVIDPNGVQITRQYDTFGRLRFESAPAVQRLADALPDSFNVAISGTSTAVVSSLPHTVLPAVVPPGRADLAVSYRVPTGEPLGAFEVVAARGGGHQLDIVQDRLGREIRRDDFASTATGRVRTQYDVLGRVARQSRPHLVADPDNQIPWIEMAYDMLDRLTRRTLPTSDDFPNTGPEVRRAYNGLITIETDERGFQHIIRHDIRGRLGRTDDIVGSGEVVQTVYEYGPFDQLDAVRRSPITGPAIVRMQYDRLGRRTDLFDPDAGHRILHYNGYGEVVRELVEGVAGDTTVVPDALGRPTQTTTVEGTTTLVWDRAVGGVGRLVSVDAPDISGAAGSGARVVTSFGYDLLGRARSRAWTLAGQTFAFDTSYDDFNRPSVLSYPQVGAGTAARRFGVQYTYFATGGDLRSALDTTRRDATGTVPFEYWRALTHNPEGRITSEVFPDSVVTFRAYERSRGLPRQIVTEQINTTFAVLQRINYQRFATGDLRTREDTVTGVTEGYDYDALRRVTSWGGNFTDDGRPNLGSFEYRYDYDALGNLTARRALTNVFPGDLEAVTYTRGGVNPSACAALTPRTTVGPHAVTAVSGTGGGDRCYDVKGNQVSAPGRQIAYTSFDLPRTIDTADGRTSFGYDGFGDRVLKQGPGGSVIALGGLYERRVDASTGISHVFYVQGGGRSIAQVVWTEAAGAVTGEDTAHLHDDHLGSIDTIGGANASVRTRLRREPFGTPVTVDRPPGIATSLDPTFRLGLGGHVEDRELGLVDMKGRIYDPRSATFLTPDPLVATPSLGQAFNRYSYVLNNPVNLIDPTGMATAAPQVGLAPGGAAPPAQSTPAAVKQAEQEPSDMRLRRDPRRPLVDAGWTSGGNGLYMIEGVGADDNGPGAPTGARNARPADQWSGGTGPTSSGPMPSSRAATVYAGPNAGQQPSDRVFAELPPAFGYSWPDWQPTNTPPPRFPSQVDLMLVGIAGLVFVPFIIPELVVTAVPAATAAATAATPLVVGIGTRADTMAAAARGMFVINMPDWMWSPPLNMELIRSLVLQGARFQLLSKINPSTLWDKAPDVPRMTIFARELLQLAGYGYTKVGQQLVPPLNCVLCP